MIEKIMELISLKDLCDRVIWINEGKLMEDGDPSIVVDKYEEYKTRKWVRIDDVK